MTSVACMDRSDDIEHYTKLWENSLSRFERNMFEYDNLIDDIHDDRYGISLLIRPDDPVKQAIQEFLRQIREIEPEQYYYRDSDIHITLLSIISCFSGFNLQQIDLEKYYNVISRSTEGLPEFKINFCGITASPSAIMIQGFLENNIHNQLRTRLRENFKKSGLQQSIDTRYTIETYHATVVRFRKPISRSKEIISLLKRYRETNFGTTTVSQVELVANDWYQRREKVKTLKIFELNKPAKILSETC